MKDMINIIKDGNLVIPMYLLKNYKKFNLKMDEFIFMMYLTYNQVNNTTKDTSSNKKSNSTTNNSNKKENIKTIKELPKTGVTTGIGIAVLVTIGIAIYYYNKYNNIKK